VEVSFYYAARRFYFHHLLIYLFVGAISAYVCSEAACSFSSEGKYPYTDFIIDCVYKVFKAIYRLLVILFIMLFVSLVYGGGFCMVLHYRTTQGT
jgi:amino acid transporter